MVRPTECRARLTSPRGQGLIEMALVLPIALVIVLGVVEVSYALLHQHIVSKLTREGSNLISRDVTLLDASTALQNMATAPVNFANGSRLIFSVLRKGATVGTANYDRIILYQRHAAGNLVAASTLTTAGGGSFGPAPDYQANNADTDPNLRIANLPAGLDIARGGFLYVTEVFTAHPLITPFDRFGVTVPSTLHSIAYF